ncbi:atpase, vacuolar er assembly factor, vma12 [Trichoderma arundinaceum]|uniref:Atpase, vacuolar er assembly factor, vma12 n=1 Tax=Trichoderma arundinaceum TaxID=490622 RepID=A0A395NR49_TRIAR|nr:atpase, vacuolar er assembly factor, vma12 [Trichoderma arundinaceum]
MVLLTMTPSIVDALKQLEEQHKRDEPNDDTASSSTERAIGNPISHSEIISLHKRLNASQSSAPKYSLEQLLQGSRVYIPPPPPKPEPSDEYKALMARLRREEDARSYERMINPPPPLETFQNRFPNAAQAFAEANRPSKSEDLGDDQVTYNEIHRQVMLIINFLVSIAGVAVTLWIAGRWWSLSSRIFLSLGGSIVVAIAEVAVYSSYVWRMGEAKSKQVAVKEIKEVVQTWVVGQGGDGDDKSVLLRSKDGEDEQVRRRIPATTTTDSPKSTKPGLHHLRKRDKPLRTYGRQTSTPEAQTEPPSKKPRLSALQNQQEQSASNPREINDTTKPDEAAVAPASEAKTKQDALSREKKEKREQSPKKGSILSYFKPAPQAPKEEPPSQPQDSQPEEPIPLQPTPKRKQSARRKPRLLKIKVITHEMSDQSSQETDSHTLRTRSSRHSLKSTTSNAPTTTSESTTPSKSSPSSTSPSASPKRKSGRNNPKSSPKTKSSSPSVQTTLNISTQAPFSECRICDTVWNPLYPDDVKFHNKTHKAVLRAQKRKMDDL